MQNPIRMISKRMILKHLNFKKVFLTSIQTLIKELPNKAIICTLKPDKPPEEVTSYITFSSTVIKLEC